MNTSLRNSSAKNGAFFDGEKATHPVFLGFLVAQMVKNSLAIWKTWVQSLGWEDPLEKGKATHSSILAWRIPWAEEPGGGDSPRGHKESDTTE